MSETNKEKTVKFDVPEKPKHGKLMKFLLASHSRSSGEAKHVVKPRKDGKDPKKEALKVLVLFLGAIIITVWHLATSARIAPANTKGVGHAGKRKKEQRRRKEEAIAEKKEEENLMKSRVQNVDCNFFTAQSLIPHEYNTAKPLLGTYTTFDVKDGDVVSLLQANKNTAAGSDSSASGVYIMPHHNLANVRSAEDRPCTENSFVATKPIMVGGELYVNFDDPCLAHMHQAGTPRLEDYIRADEIMNDAFQVGRQMKQKKGARLNLGVLDDRYVQFMKDTISRFDVVTASLIPGSFHGMREASRVGFVECLAPRKGSWIISSGQCVDAGDKHAVVDETVTNVKGANTDEEEEL
mmetsp:Transcript_29234/g.42922  ORF Transcript_29234/g.42922 Transcript_29234/m.42922 type:complete len:352 (-) Transcript_29234:205-1260(-)|eukprot:CAMPEP_0116014256 /NCGR_PEP_ID=MMETSP0321-20121206/6178_1 /TAXON_ID=163516 /ORGANISM="Leptocylindrus danicus var. danicus, Strain B650" /LENGTH=351 /DNA_ID=CAMNT_0003483891 /DNA_START=38 /DNA_END=1093 /DNA_ORIENTATION=+